MTVAQAIAAWCFDYQASARARQLAVHAIIDTLGCMAAGCHEPTVEVVRQAFTGQRLNGRLGGFATRPDAHCPPALTALIDGTAAHALDYDDNFIPGMSHASAVLVPALLALAHQGETTGAQLIDAYLSGLQAQAFIGAAIGYEHYRAGWHGTSTVGLIGSAAATAHLLGLDARAMAMALAIATSFASGTKGQFGTLIKPFHAGHAARGAVEAALLAQAGMQARADILEDPQGFVSLSAASQPVRWDKFAIHASNSHIIETTGVLPKRYPCCGSTHLILDSLVELMRETKLNPDAIERIECHIGIANYRNLPYRRPQDQMQAKFSLPYCIAKLLRNGQLLIQDFYDEAIADAQDDPLLDKVVISAYSEAEEALTPPDEERLPHRLTLILQNGQRLERARSRAVGSLHYPFSDDDRRQKFDDCFSWLADKEPLYHKLLAMDCDKPIDWIRYHPVA